MAWVALGVGQLVAGIGRPQGSPVAAVGSAAIDHTPPAVKNFAISAFGSHDKTVLIIGILVLLAVFSAVIGVAAMRKLRYGYLGLAIFAVIGLAAALTRPNAALWDVLPTLIGALAGAYALRLLVRAAGGEAGRSPAPAVTAAAGGAAAPGRRPGAGLHRPRRPRPGRPRVRCPRPVGHRRKHGVPEHESRSTGSPAPAGSPGSTGSPGTTGQPRPVSRARSGPPSPRRPAPRGSLAAAAS